MNDSDRLRELATALQDLVREIRRHGGRMPDGFDFGMVRNAETALSQAAPAGMQEGVRRAMAEAFLGLGPFYAVCAGREARVYGADDQLLWVGETIGAARPGDNVRIPLPDDRWLTVEVRKDKR